MSTTVKDANVDDFLDRVKELDERRKLEDEIRRKKLRQEVALKKQKNNISLVRPVSKPTNSSPPLSPMDITPPASSSSVTAASPSPYKYKDTLDVEKTIQRLIGRQPISKPIDVITISDSESDSEEAPHLPERKPKLPLRKPTAPIRETSNNGVYIPRPNALAVISATAAAKAPQLKQRPVDSSLGERSPDLMERAKLLNLSKTPSPRKESSSPQRQSWLNSALNHGDISKQSIASTESKIKMKPLVPNKPSSLTENSEKSKKQAAREAEILQNLRNPTLNHTTPTTTTAKTDSSYKVPELRRSPTRERKQQEEPKLPELRKSPTRQIHKEQETPEALARFNKLKPLLPQRKISYHEPELLQKLNKLNRSTPIQKAEQETPEALQKATKLKPAVPLKKPILETPELLTKKTSLKKNNEEETTVQKKKNFEKENLELLQKSMNGLRKFAPPSRSQTENALSPVRLPFADPNAKFPSIIRPKTFDDSTLQTSLTHVTKSRAKGPKRRLPKNLQLDNKDEAVKIDDFKIRNSAKKTPPQIKTSSRVVSNKLEKRIFSNSDLFI